MTPAAAEESSAPAGVTAAGGPREWLLYGLLAVMVFFWSLNFIVGKVALRHFPPLLLGGLRTAFAGVMILPAYAWEARRSPGRVRWTRADVPALLMLGFLGVAVNQLFFIVGLSRTSVAHAAILIGLNPLLVLALAGAMRMERITPRKVAGMLTALAGVALITAVPSKMGHESAVGNLFVFLGGLAFALFTIGGKRVAGRHGGITVSTFAYAGGALMLAPVTLWQGWGFRWSAVGLAGWASLIYMAAFPSVLCYLIYYWALSHAAASRVAALSYLQPLIATLLAVPLLGEPVTPPLMAGGAMVFAGIYITERSR